VWFALAAADQERMAALLITAYILTVALVAGLVGKIILRLLLGKVIQWSLGSMDNSLLVGVVIL
jgi:hypothetical protein